MSENDRPQDVGRRHRRAPRELPSEATRTLLASWHDALRAQLQLVLDELDPQPDPSQPGLDGKPLPAKRPALSTRAQLVSLGVQVARELGTAIDVRPPTAAERPAEPPRRRGGIDYR